MCVCVCVCVYVDCVCVCVCVRPFTVFVRVFIKKTTCWSSRKLSEVGDRQLGHQTPIIKEAFTEIKRHVMKRMMRRSN